MARVRVHQHVNPLSPYYRQEPAPVDLSAAFARPAMPLHLDIGSARGRFLLGMASVEAATNYLGVEIREPLVDEANQIRDEMGLGNLHYVFSNAMIWLDRLLGDVPAGVLRTVTIHFPDPWFKKKHAKRRMVNRELVETVVNKLDAGGVIFIQTDIAFLADEMFALFRADTRITETPVDVSPFPVKTERERAVEAKGLPVYRRLFRS
jgi:tRNA (guanine-N7-)-methyltransferase